MFFISIITYYTSVKSIYYYNKIINSESRRKGNQGEGGEIEQNLNFCYNQLSI